MLFVKFNCGLGGWVNLNTSITSWTSSIESIYWAECDSGNLCKFYFAVVVSGSTDFTRNLRALNIECFYFQFSRLKKGFTKYLEMTIFSLSWYLILFFRLQSKRAAVNPEQGNFCFHYPGFKWQFMLKRSSDSFHSVGL